MVMISYFIGNSEKSLIDREIDTVLEEMHDIGVNSDRYPNQLGYLERLVQTRKNHKEPAVSRDTIALVMGNLLGILIIIAYEQKHVITSRSFSQLIRPS
jgi:uncharacterized protein Smg (DUF494 family)